MSTSRKSTQKAAAKRIRKNIPERGRFSEKVIFAVAGVLLLLGIGIFWWKPWESLSLPFTSGKVTVTKPTMDMVRARQMTIDPEKDTVMQIMTSEKVRVTMTIPKGALKEKTLVKMIPFYYDKKSEAPTAGVVVGPASITFEVPVTLSFNFSESNFKNQAPKSAVEKTIRSTGSAQVLQIDSEGKSLTPTLVSRGTETETYLPARILTGGAYVFTLDGKHQIDIAKQALDKDNMHTLTVMESATVLLFNNRKLSDPELKKAKAAVAKILSKKTPPPFELYAALILQKKISNPSFSFIPKAYAYETGEGYYQAVCRDNSFRVEEYLGFAKAAQLMGYDHIGDSCINKAKNKVAEEAKKVIASGNPDIKAVMVALQNVQLVGVDEETNLDEQLMEKAKEVVTNEAREVAQDPNSSLLDAAVAMQKMEAIGADQGPTYEALKDRVTKKVEQVENDVERTSDEHSRDMEQKEVDWEEAARQVEEEEKRIDEEVAKHDLDEEEILSTAVWSQMGIGLLKAFGFEELDRDSLKKKFDEMQEQTKEFAAAGYEACLAFQAEGIEADCAELKSKTDDLLSQAEEASYRAEEQIGQMQSQEYETPEYLENNADFELYFEEDLTPTPEDEGYSGVGSQDETYQESDDTDYEGVTDNTEEQSADTSSDDITSEESEDE